MRLSPRAREALALMADGWSACWMGGRGHGAFLQQGKIGWGGAHKKLHQATLWTLIRKKLVQCYGSGIGSKHYAISRRGRAALALKESHP